MIFISNPFFSDNNNNLIPNKTKEEEANNIKGEKIQIVHDSVVYRLEIHVVLWQTVSLGITDGSWTMLISLHRAEDDASVSSCVRKARLDSTRLNSVTGKVLFVVVAFFIGWRMIVEHQAALSVAVAATAAAADLFLRVPNQPIPEQSVVINLVTHRIEIM